MALIKYVDDEVYQEALGSPQVANLLRALFNSPDWAKAFSHLAGVQMSKLALPAADREVVLLQTGAIFNADYVWAQHEGISEVVGISERQRNAIKIGDYADEIFSVRQQTLLKFVRSIADRQDSLGACLAEAKAHFTDQELVEIIGLHGFAYTVSSITSVLQIEPDRMSGAALLRFAGQLAK
ncbi:hypothetical protein KZJ38_16825 [Paraburkholderia edwinii]|jgi:alkylhydroperoxidase family enzyme|uniref:Alkylhydroperoxidase family enzyme n=1 Tax=Paraburkholderia edwinii TaxID=2861782 RepID=A0ABX8UGL3_9BURK|nr:hypothetical protein [Paraburkholderia edwinii]QYD67953.1 hypothetical protein KZJ38_16825 [Paraburkholderia edwinii]